MEALYQALTGAGYDQGCEGVYDKMYDVPPFIASATDPFGGTGGETWDPSVSGGGTLGGLGFRADSERFVAYVTDSYLRDPDDGYDTPAGCPMDAGSLDVIGAVAALGSRLVAVAFYSGLGMPQMEDLATATGSTGDLDGDGSYTDLLAQQSVDWGTTIGASVAASAYYYDDVLAEVTDDPLGAVSLLSASSWTATQVHEGDSMTATLSLVAPAATGAAQSGTVVVGLVADGVRTLDTAEVEVLVRP
jgi:hypothetical protein